MCVLLLYVVHFDRKSFPFNYLWHQIMINCNFRRQSTLSFIVSVACLVACYPAVFIYVIIATSFVMIEQSMLGSSAPNAVLGLLSFCDGFFMSNLFCLANISS